MNERKSNPPASGTAKIPAEGARDREILVTRVFDAPRDVVFAAWTDPKHLERWHAPHGCAIRFSKIDARPGGGFHSCIRTPDGHECWCVGKYLEIVRPERIVYSMAVSDKDGKLIKPAAAGMDPEWPAETIVTLTFEEHEGKTKLTLHQTVGEALASRTGALPSWFQMLDRLAEIVTKK